MFDFIFRRGNPTNAWNRQANLSLTADLSNFAFNGIKVGSPFEQLSCLGRSESGASETIEYFDLGIIFDWEPDRTFSGYALIFSDDYNFHKRYAGTIEIDGVSVAAQEIPAALGEPYWIDTDETETIQFYEFGSHEIMCELALDGSIKEVVLTTIPSMADPVQRERYGVTKPWPWPTR